VLRRVGSDFEVISNGVFLMDTRDGRSERLLVRAALDARPDARSLLIGGLGVGFSLREAVADVTLTRIDVVEIEDAVVRWHRSHLAGLTGEALADPRVAVIVADLADHLGHRVATYDVVCVDVDNGPTWTVTENNAALYDDRGTQAMLDTLRPGGVLAVWSAMPVPDYEQRFRNLGCDVVLRTIDVRRGEPDVIYLARP
jgi:spermidine synthase